jgi:hypothetical protein
MTDFKKLKQSSSIEKLTKALESQGRFQKDERYWQPTVDKAGNGYATIRFLDSPKVDGDDGQPFVQIWSHGFKGPTGQWYIENSLTTLGEDDPVSEYNSKLWNTGTEANKQIVREQKRRLSYISNILVINDPGNPANEGKIFLYSYGKKIFDKIRDKLGAGEGKKGELVDPDEVLFNPYNFWEGANFKLKIRKVEGYRNYDKSEFLAQSPVSDNDAEIEKIWAASHSLKELLDRKHFKSYDELQKKLNAVLGLGSQTNTKPATQKKATTAESVVVPDEVETVSDETPVVGEPVAEDAGDGEENPFAEYERMAAD